jgi:hypothetical protein
MSVGGTGVSSSDSDNSSRDYVGFWFLGLSITYFLKFSIDYFFYLTTSSDESESSLSCGELSANPFI